METKNCPFCHNDFHRKNEISSNWKTKKYCSRKCYKEGISKHKRGDNWKCAKCKIIKSNDQFYKYHSKTRKKWRRGMYCRECLPLVRQEYMWKSNYGITRSQFESMLSGQNRVCKICGKYPNDKRGLCVDHNHKTGQVRGLLCVPCNAMIGNAKEDIKILKKSIEYLNENNE